MAKVLNKFLALVLVLAVVMSMTGMSAFAMDDDETIVETEATVVIDADEGEENDEAPVEEETPVEDEAPAEEAAPVEEEAPAEEEAILDTQSGEGVAEDVAAEVTYVAQIGEVKYETLQSAIDAAKDGDTVTLLKNTYENILIANKKDLTLVCSGRKIYATEANEHGIQVYCSENITLTDVAIENAKKSGLLVNASSVTVVGSLTFYNNGYDNAVNVGYGSNISGTHTTSLTFAKDAALYGVTSVYSDKGDLERAAAAGTTITIDSVPGMVHIKGIAATPDCWIAADGSAVSSAVAQIGEVKYTTLQAAIDDAEGKTVTLLTDVDVTWVTVSKNMTLDLNGHTLTGDTGHPSEYHGVIDVTNGATLTVDGNRGKITGTASCNCGGIMVKDGSLVMNGGEISGFVKSNINDASAIFVDEGCSATLNNVNVLNNTGNAPAIRAKGDLTVNGGKINGNHATYQWGGAICYSGANVKVTITGTEISNNHCDTYGGAVAGYADSGSVLTMKNVTMTGNSTNSQGGAVFVRGGNSGLVVIEGGTINGNHSNGAGGAVSVWGAKAELKDVIVTGNTAGGSGGAILVDRFPEGNANAHVTLDNVTIAGNTSSGWTGGVHVGNGTLTMKDSTVTGNTSANGAGVTIGNNGSAEFEGSNTISRNTVTNVPQSDNDAGADNQNLFYRAVVKDKVTGLDTVSYVDIELAVAKVGDTYYTTLQAAISAAGMNDIVELLKDTAESVVVRDGKDITLNIPEGVTLTATTAHAITNYSTLTVTGNGTVDGGNVAGSGAIFNDAGATANLNGCTFTGSKWYVIKNLGEMTVAGANVKQNDSASSGIANGWYDSTKAHANDCGTPHFKGRDDASLTITSGSFSGGINTVKNDDCGTLVIKDGTFANTVQYVIMNWNVAAIEGGTFTAPAGFKAVWNNDSAKNDTGNRGELSISGGTFSSEVEPNHCAEGYLPVANGSTYGVVKYVPTITADPEDMTGAGTVTLTVDVPSNLSAEIEVTGKNVETGETITVTPAGDRTYTVSLPNAAAIYGFRVDIGDLFKGEDVEALHCYVSVRYVAPVIPSVPSTPSEPENTDEPTETTEPIVDIEDDETALADRPFLFEDVQENDWFYSHVKNIFEKSLINGTTTTTYEPQTELSRGMIVTILWRIAGEPIVETTSTFADVPENEYYFDAINWGAENNIARGYDAETFAPDKLVSREELVTLMYRYAELIGLDLTEIDEDAFAEFGDAESVQEFAVDSMKWAVSAGIINGDNGMLNPQDYATRAEAAKIVNCFIQIPEVAAVMQANAETESETENENA